MRGIKSKIAGFIFLFLIFIGVINVHINADYYPYPVILLPPLASDSYAACFVTPCSSEDYNCTNVQALYEEYGISLYPEVYLHQSPVDSSIKDSAWYHDYPFKYKAEDLSYTVNVIIKQFKKDYLVPDGTITKSRIVADSIAGVAVRSYVTDPTIYNNDVDKVGFLHCPLEGCYAGDAFYYFDAIVGTEPVMTPVIALSVSEALLLGPLSIEAVNAAAASVAYYEVLNFAKILQTDKNRWDLYKNIVPTSTDMKKLNSRTTLDNIKYRILAGKTPASVNEGMVNTLGVVVTTLVAEIEDPVQFGVLSWTFAGTLGIGLAAVAFDYYDSKDGDGLLETTSMTGENIPDVVKNTEYLKVRPYLHNTFMRNIPFLGGYKYKLDYTSFEDVLALVDEAPSMSVSGTNIHTIQKMEPDGAYLDIQKPVIHVDGHIDDYLIKWMADNDRLRLQYDNYANVDIAVNMNNYPFDYAGDVGRGYYSYGHNLLVGGANKINISAKNAANLEGNKINRTYYSVGLMYPADGENNRQFASATICYVYDAATGNVTPMIWTPDIQSGDFPEHTFDITGKTLAGEYPYVYNG